PVVLREIFLHAGRHRVSFLADEVCKDRRIDLLGSVVSGRGATHGDARRGNFVLPDRDWLAPEREKTARRQATRRVGSHSTQPCRRQWLLYRRRKSRWPRTSRRRRWNRVLGPIFHCRNTGRNPGQRKRG